MPVYKTQVTLDVYFYSSESVSDEAKKQLAISALIKEAENNAAGHILGQNILLEKVQHLNDVSPDWRDALPYNLPGNEEKTVSELLQ